MLNRLNETFNAAITYSSGTAPESIKTGYINGDGVLDVVMTEYPSDTMSILLGRGDGTFNSRLTFATSDQPGALVLADFNRDSVPDIAHEDGTADAIIFLVTTASGIGPTLPFSLKTVADARQVLPMFKDRLEKLAAQQRTIGVLRERLSIGINNLMTGRDNFVAAEGRIRDTDITKDASIASRLRILQQFGASVLAQANRAPSITLALLYFG